MNTRSALFLSTSTAVAGFVAAWLIFRSDGTCKIDDASSPVEARGLQREAPQMRAQPESPDLDRPVSRVPAFTAPPPEPMPAPVVPGQTVANSTASDSLDPRSLPERSPAEIEVKLKEIDAYLLNKQRAITDKRFDEGRFEHLEDQPVLDPYSIYSYRPAHPGWDRVLLSREEFPELYAYKDDSVRLNKAIYGDRYPASSAPAKPK
jgi:hypothetical protein